MLPAAYRLTRRCDFSRVYAKGRSAACREFVLYSLKRPGEQVRIGFSSSRKLGHAVVRNRQRRVFRHAAAAVLAEFPRGRDYVFVIRRGALDKDLGCIKKAISRELARLAEPCRGKKGAQ
ncbi:MAG: ribonuclease P protein component [Firmicutes bacterium]|nr:ribonuclease P protein component [Bacillota bacterium]